MLVNSIFSPLNQIKNVNRKKRTSFGTAVKNSQLKENETKKNIYYNSQNLVFHHDNTLSDCFLNNNVSLHNIHTDIKVSFGEKNYNQQATDELKKMLEHCYKDMDFPQKVRDLICEQNADPNAEGENGFTVFRGLAFHDYCPEEIVTDILEKGADINKADKRGLTPLACAAMGRRINVCRIFYKHGAKPRIGDEYFDAFDYAGKFGFFDFQKDVVDVVEKEKI